MSTSSPKLPLPASFSAVSVLEVVYSGGLALSLGDLKDVILPAALCHLLVGLLATHAEERSVGMSQPGV